MYLLNRIEILTVKQIVFLTITLQIITNRFRKLNRHSVDNGLRELKSSYGIFIVQNEWGEVF